MSQATIDQTRQIVRHQLSLLWKRPDLAIHIAPVMLWGAPGVGKSAVIRELCTELGIGFIDVRLSQREPVDLRGLPVPDEDQVRWLLSSEWPRDPESKGIILFDELTAADRTLQVAAYEFILDRRLGDLYRVPPGWLVCAAGNRSEDRAVAMTLSSALANRFCHLELHPNVEQWTGWAVGRGLDSDVIAFLRYKPESFFRMEGNLERGWPSPRSWERVALAVEHGEQLDSSLISLIVAGLVGNGPATEFLAFRRQRQALPDVEALLRGEVQFEVPKSADQRYALTAALAHHLWRGPKMERERRIDNFLRIGLELGSDFAVMAMMDAMRHVESAERAGDAQALFGHPRYQEWMTRHGEGLQATPPAPVEVPGEEPSDTGNPKVSARPRRSIRPARP